MENVQTGLYRDDEPIILCNINNQQTNKIRKKIISIFKSIDFKIEITTNLTEIDFLDGTFNLERNTSRTYKNPNDNLTYINISSNHTSQIIKHLNQTISESLSRNYLSAEIFEQSKSNYEKALKNVITKKNCKNNTRRRARKIIWFNPSFSFNVKTNVTKIFLPLIDAHFP